MDDYEGLLKTVIAAPDDDLSRLAMADWFAEHSREDRAELIRVQIEIADTRHKPLNPRLFKSHDRFRGDCWYDCPACKLERRETKILREADWSAPAGWKYKETIDVDGRGPCVGWTRGFITAVHAPMSAMWNGHGCSSCAGVGTGFFYPSWGATTCPACLGIGIGGSKGITPAFRDLCRHHPVESVMPTGMRPYYNRYLELGERWSWWQEREWRGRGDTRNQHGNLPDVLFHAVALLYPHNVMYQHGPADHQHVRFKSWADAMTALGKGLVYVARMPAGKLVVGDVP